MRNVCFQVLTVFSCSCLQLFELLGPEGLDMISTLLQRRVAIVDSLLRIQPDRTVYPSGKAHVRHVTSGGEILMEE